MFTVVAAPAAQGKTMVTVYYSIVWERGKKHTVNRDSPGRGAADRLDSTAAWNISTHVRKKESYKNLK